MSSLLTKSIYTCKNGTVVKDKTNVTNQKALNMVAVFGGKIKTTDSESIVHSMLTICCFLFKQWDYFAPKVLLLDKGSPTLHAHIKLPLIETSRNIHQKTYHQTNQSPS